MILCGPRGRKGPVFNCQNCEKHRSTKQCDFQKTGSTKTCDKHLCDNCAVPIAKDIDYCPGHPR